MGCPICTGVLPFCDCDLDGPTPADQHADASAMLDQIATLRAALAASEREGADLKQRLSIHDDGMADAKEEVERCREIITGMTEDACDVGRAERPEDRTLDSHGISTNADAIRYLAEIGRVEIISEAGRRVVARWRS